MWRPRAALPVALAPLAFACLFALGRGARVADFKPPSPPRVRVLEIAPWAVEPGDRVTVFGDGFPADQPAHLTFRGTLYRPGESATGGAEIGVLARVSGPTRLEFALDDATLSLFSGAGDHAIHTTFEGDLEVAFAPSAAGEPPIVGRLGNVTFDIRPRATAATRERRQQGERLLAWLGIDAAGSPLGLVIQGVAPGSRAQAAGIAAGEVILRFDGVRVESAADVVPAQGERAATLDFQDEGPQRSAGHGRTRVVSLTGFRRSSETEWTASLLAVLTALGIVLLFSAPSRPGIAAALQRVISRLRSRIGPARAGRSLAEEAIAVARQALPPWGPAAAPDALAYAVLLLLAFRECPFSSRLDVWFLFVAAVGCLGVAAFVVRPSMWSGLTAAAEVAWRHAPAAAALTSAVLLTGSLRLRELGEAQGGWPGDWLSFRSPVSMLSLWLLVASGRIEPRAAVTRSPLAALLEDTTGSGQERLGAGIEAAQRAHRVIVAGLASVLFLGGWRVPGISAARQWAHPSLELVGAVALLAKTLSLLLLMAWGRWLFPPRDAGRAAASVALSLALVAGLALAATQAWIWWAPAPSVQHFVSLLLSIALALVGVAGAHRLRHGLTSAEGDGHLSPFI